MATISRLSVDLVANSAQFRKDLEKASNSADKSFGKMMKGAKAATAAFAALGVGVGKVFQESAKTYGNFTEALSDVEAKTGATSNQLDALSKSMRNAAKATKFTATQTAEAGTFLAQAGLNVREINDALRPTLDLAAATKTSVQNTADFMTNIMKGLGMSSTELERAADVLAVTTAKSNTNLTDLATAMSYAAPSARAMGMEIEETATLIGMMANAGIKGSMAGTALRGTFASLATTGGLTEKAIAEATGSMTEQSKVLRKLGVHTKDAEGNVRGLTEILKDLKAAGGDEQDMIAIFGRRAGSAMMQFMNEGLMGADALKEKLDNARKAAEKMAATQMDNLNGDLLLFNSQLEELQMVVAENGINDLFRGLTQAATKFMKAAEPALASMAKYADEIAVGLGILGGAIVVGGIVALTSAMTGLAIAMLANPITWIVAGIVALGVGIYKVIENADMLSFYWQRTMKNMGIAIDNVAMVFKTDFANMALAAEKLWLKIKIGVTGFKLAFAEAMNGALEMFSGKINKMIELYNKIPFFDNAEAISLNISTEKATAEIQALQEKLAGLGEAAAYTFGKFDTSVFTPSTVDGGAGLDAVPAGDANQSELDEEQARLDALANQQMNHWNKLLTFENDYRKATTDLANGSWQDVLAAGSKGSKKMLMLQKAMALKSIVMSTAEGIANALKLPFPASLAAGAKVAVAGAVQLQRVKGQFHDGIDSVPNTGTYLLEQGERVVDKRLNKDMSTFLANQNQGGNTTNNNPVLNFNVQGGNAEEVEQMLMNHRGKFEGMVRDIYNESAQNSPF